MSSTIIGRSKTTPGFQGSESSRCEVIFYEKEVKLSRFTQSQQQGNISEGRSTNYKVMRLPSSASATYSGSEQSKLPVVLAVNVENKFGSAGGTWAVSLKAAQYEEQDLRKVFIEGDWADIVFIRNGKEFHTIRGIVDGVTKDRQISQSGTTSDVYVVKGRGFGKIFEDAIVYYDTFLDSPAIQEIVLSIFADEPNFIANAPNDVVRIFLFSFLERLGADNRAVIQSPRLLPGESDTNFSKSANLYNDNGFSGDPSRVSTFTPTFFNPGIQNLWTLASNHADGPMCELFCDLGPTDNRDYFGSPRGFSRSDIENLEEVIEPVPLGNAKSTVYFRDRPLPTSERGRTRGKRQPMWQGPYYDSITTHIVPEEQIVASSLTKSGDERINTIAVTGLVAQDLLGWAFNVRLPIYNWPSIEKHGIRRIDLSSIYMAAPNDPDNPETTNDILGLSTEQRDILRDFHCVNHLLYKGTITLRPGRPDIRIGSRIVLLTRGTGSTRNTAVFYVEGVKHTYGALTGIVTVLTVTRGFNGTDPEYDDLVRTEALKFTQPAPKLTAAENADVIKPYTPPVSPAAPDPTRPDDRTGDYIYPDTPDWNAIWIPAAQSARQRDSRVRESWVRSPALRSLLSRESRFRVGVVTGEGRASAARLRAIHQQIRSGQRTKLTASGFGQLIRSQVARFYPSGVNGIGNPTEEAVGMLLYIADRYGSPEAAWRYWNLIPKPNVDPPYNRRHWY